MVAALTLMLAIIAVVAVLHLAVKVIHDVLFTSFDPTQPAVFQDLFGTIFTVLMALEFKCSVFVTTEDDGGVVCVKIVILIGLLAITRKVIILDLGTVPALQIIGLSAAMLHLESSTGWCATVTATTERRERLIKPCAATSVVGGRRC